MSVKLIVWSSVLTVIYLLLVLFYRWFLNELDRTEIDKHETFFKIIGYSPLNIIATVFLIFMLTWYVLSEKITKVRAKIVWGRVISDVDPYGEENWNN